MPRVLRLIDDPVTGRPTTVETSSARTRGVRRWLALAANADLLHADGPASVRLGAVLRRLGRKKLVAGGVNWDRTPGWPTRLALRSADRVVAATLAEVERYHALGIPRDRIAVIPPGVAPAPAPPDPIEFRRSLSIPGPARLILAAGRFDAASDMQSAIWSFDILRYTAPDVHLVLIGDGPERHRLERYGRAAAYDDYRIRFAGNRTDRQTLFTLADVVWVTPGRESVAVALEALAAGRPVVAFDHPDLDGIVDDGVTGRRVPPGDRARMAAATAGLLGDPAERRRLGAAGRERAMSFPAAAMAERMAALYDGLISSQG